MTSEVAIASKVVNPLGRLVLIVAAAAAAAASQLSRPTSMPLPLPRALRYCLYRPFQANPACHGKSASDSRVEDALPLRFRRI